MAPHDDRTRAFVHHDLGALLGHHLRDLGTDAAAVGEVLIQEAIDAAGDGDEIIVANMDWPFPKMRNTKHQMPATLSIIKLKK